MEKFRICASYMVYCHLDIEAENIDAAREIAYKSDGGDFKQSDELGGWNIDAIKKLEG